MQSFQKKASKLASKFEMNNRGQSVLSVGVLMISIFMIVMMIFGIYMGISTLNPTSFFSTGSLEANETANLQRNLTVAGSAFGAKITTLVTILVVVIILGFIGLLIGAVWAYQRYGGAGSRMS